MDMNDKLPPCGMYAELLEKASTLFNESIDVCRSKYGKFTVKEWDDLFKNPPTPKKVRTTKKKIFLISTEQGRIRGKISFYIAEIVPNKGLRLIENFFTCSMGSNKGLENEAIGFLITKGELPPTALNDSGYRNPKVNDYSLIMVEGRGLNYINQIN